MIVDQGGKAYFMKCDVTSEKDCKTVMEEIKINLAGSIFYITMQASSLGRP